MPIRAATTAMSAILLNDGKMSCQRRSSLIGGNSSPSTSVSVPVELRAGGLEAGIGERDGDVAQLPHQEPEVGDDDGRAEWPAAKSSRRP